MHYLCCITFVVCLCLAVRAKPSVSFATVVPVYIRIDIALGLRVLGMRTMDAVVCRVSET